MTIEEEFFKAFGIEPDCSYLFLIDEKGINEAARTLSLGSKADLKRFIVNCGGKGRVVKSTNSPHIYYPEITAEILLKLICLLNKEGIYGYSDWGGCFPCGETIPELKESILKDCLNNKNLIFFQVCKLFEEEQ